MNETLRKANEIFKKYGFVIFILTAIFLAVIYAYITYTELKPADVSPMVKFLITGDPYKEGDESRSRMGMGSVYTSLILASIIAYFIGPIE